MFAALRGRRLLSGRRPPSRPPRASRVGAAASDVVGVTPAGEPWAMALGPQQRTVLAFLTSSCTTCQAFWSTMAAGAGDRGDGGDGGDETALVVVTPDPATEDRRSLARRPTGQVPVVMATAAWLAYGVSGSPWFVIVVDGIIRAEGTASTWSDMLALIPTA